MIEEIYEEKMKKVKVDEKIYCDICGNEINKKDGYYALMTGHNDWGNDSCDSIEHYELCSKECLTEKFNMYLERSKGKINTEYFEVDHRKGYEVELRRD